MYTVIKYCRTYIRLIYAGNFFLNLLILSVQHARSHPPFGFMVRRVQDDILKRVWPQLLGLHLALLGGSNFSLETVLFGPNNDASFNPGYFKISRNLSTPIFLLIY